MPFFNVRRSPVLPLLATLLATLSTTHSPIARSADVAPVCPLTNQVQFCDVEDITPPTGVHQLIYSEEHSALVLKNAASAIATIDLTSHATTLHFSNLTFTDMSLSPSGRIVFAADYGGENIGYGTPYVTSYVHRLDLADLAWGSPETAYIAGNIAAVADDQFILMSLDQWVTFTNDQWSGGSAVVPLNTSSGNYWGPAYYAGVYEGDFRYVPVAGRLLHGNSGLSSQEVQAFHLAGNDFAEQEGTGIYGSAQGYGAEIALATDYTGFYYGSLEVDPLDVTHTLRSFPEAIYAATGDISFGENNYYDAHTGQPVGSLGFSATVYGLNALDSDFWVFDASQNLLRHFVRDDRVFEATFD